MGESRTWKYNIFAPGQPYLSLLDRIEKDDVFKLNLILNGGWTKDTMLFLPRLVEQALDQKAWNRRYGHIAFGDRREYYIRRAARFKIRDGASGEAQSAPADAPNLTEAEEREMQVRALGKGKGITALTAPPSKAPDPAVKFSTFWNRDSAARWGYASVKEFLQDQKDHSLPYQRSAPGGAAGSSSDTQMGYVGPAGPGGAVNPYPDDLIAPCLQCNE